MTFWALGALDRVKNFSEKLGVKDYGTAIKNYIVLSLKPRLKLNRNLLQTMT